MMLLYILNCGAIICDLEKFLRTIEQSGLTLNFKKCKWAQKRVQFCGKIVGSGQILSDPEKLLVLDKMNRPRTKKEVSQMLSFFGYFRDHIHNYTEMSKPLTDLTFKRFVSNVPWGAPQQTAFEQLKEALKRATEEPLYPVDFGKPFHLFVDASQHTVSSAMTQIDEEGRHLPIAFSSTKLNEAQKFWSVIEKEAYAVLVALKKYRHWLLFGLTVLYCDHNPLSYLTESAPRSAELMRWALALQE